MQAKTKLKCWAVDLRTFEERVLFSAKVKKLFDRWVRELRLPSLPCFNGEKLLAHK